jgi:hypothetical protein
VAAERATVLTVVEPTSIPTRNSLGAESDMLCKREALRAETCGLIARLFNPYSLLPCADCDPNIVLLRSGFNLLWNEFCPWPPSSLRDPGESSTRHFRASART